MSEVNSFINRPRVRPALIVKKTESQQTGLAEFTQGNRIQTNRCAYLKERFSVYFILKVTPASLFYPPSLGCSD